MIERLKLLTPSSVDWRKTTRTTGGTLTREDVNGALAALTPEESALAYAKYLTTDDTRDMYINRLYGHVMAHTMKLAAKENWPSGPLCAMVQMAIDEVIGVVCKRCRGASTLIIDQTKKTCPKCNGTGYGRLTTRELSAKFSMTPSNYYRRWRKRYNAVIELLRQWDTTIHFQIKKQLTDR